MNWISAVAIGAVVVGTGLTAARASAADDVSQSASDTAADAGEEEKGQQAASGEVLVNPVALAFGVLGAEIGVGLTKGVSLNPSVAFINLDSGGVKGSSIGVGLGLQIFPAGSLYQGWFVLPQLAYASAEATSGTQKATSSAFVVGALGGYQWDFRPFTLRLGAGVAYYAASAKGDDLEVGLSGVAPALDASLGVSF